MLRELRQKIQHCPKPPSSSRVFDERIASGSVEPKVSPKKIIVNASTISRDPNFMKSNFLDQSPRPDVKILQ